MIRWPAALVSIAHVAGFVGLPLWLLSYAWLLSPLTRGGVPASNYLVIVGEVGALLAGTFALIVGLTLRRRFQDGSSGCRSAARARMLGAVLLFLVVVPNLVGAFWTTIAAR